MVTLLRAFFTARARCAHWCRSINEIVLAAVRLARSDRLDQGVQRHPTVESNAVWVDAGIPRMLPLLGDARTTSSSLHPSRSFLPKHDPWFFDDPVNLSRLGLLHDDPSGYRSRWNRSLQVIRGTGLRSPCSVVPSAAKRKHILRLSRNSSKRRSNRCKVARS